MRSRRGGALALGLTLAVLLAVAGCTKPTHITPPWKPKLSSGPLEAPRNIHMRSSFDSDPSLYVGRFLPDGIATDKIDENAAAQKVCGKYIAYKKVSVSETSDHIFSSSTGFKASLGVAGVGSAKGGSGAEAGVRVKYNVTEKMQGYIKDIDAFDKCCRDAPDQCTKLYIGEFLRGTGLILINAGSASDFEAGGKYQQFAASVEFKDGWAWKSARNFTNMYFAFKTVATDHGKQSTAAMGSGDDCSWAQSPPKRSDGKYFVGVSNPLPSEGEARNHALDQARANVIKYLGEYLTLKVSAEVGSVKAYMADADVVSAISRSLGSRVKAERWCKAERLRDINGYKMVSRVLAFFPEREEAVAAKAALTIAIKTLEQKNALPAGQADKMRKAAKKLK